MEKFIVFLQKISCFAATQVAATIACHGSWRSLEAKSNFRGYWRDVLMDLIGFIVRNDSVVSVLMVQKVVLTFYNPTETF